MYITARERQILESLLTTEHEITVKDLANKIDVSVRTVHRDLKGVEDILKEYDLRLVKKSGVGIQIIGDAEQVENLRLFLFNITHNEYTPEERQTIILCALLESTEPVKLIALANDLNVTIATVSNDLNKVEERLEKFNHLSLIRKRGYGVEIVGSETAKRKAMSMIITENVDEYELLSLIRENIQKKSTQQTNSISERLLGLVEKNNLLIVEKAVEEINRELPYSIADSAYMGLVVHLALAMERILQGENISIDQSYLETLQVTPEFTIAKKIIERLEKVFNTHIPKAEIGYITMHLRGAKLRHDKEYLIEDTSLQIALKAKSLISYVEKRVDQELSHNQSLLQGLVAHLSPAIFRIKQNMGITNPLLEKIKSDYAELFAIVEDGVKVIFPDLDVPDEEIGYLVMHFGSVLIGSQNQEPLKALVVCSSGIGTSKMLATRLQKELTEIKEFKNVSLFEFNQMDHEQYDVILSTIRIPEMNRDYIIVNPILTRDEVEKIKSYIGQHVTKKLVKRVGSNENTGFQPFTIKEQTIEKMQKMTLYSETISTILQGFTVQKNDQKSELATILTKTCELLFDQHVIADVNMVVADLKRREKLGGLGIPNTTLALYHTRSEAVLKPAFLIHALTEPLEIMAMDQTMMEVETILVLLSPENLPSAALEVLSQISSSIIENEQSISLIESQEERLISSYLASKLEQFFHEKVNELRSV
ncbi:BglG family transcription antiterminator [Halalkalibacter nanhaiisediminis]|uniref:Mannitol operon transcriptional antiterminator n=1 Tax=Halalkalibacter nanhaiisediminis TaxID=688079 RepID=A0A562QD95_9BACI|nr:BglG family transcription antiterminator [Halalkalibacter nanhaiisediminis]TWI54679.1 mannitol operon transcriptional antiterminator [Halalkalibacter nanhaiisediminis]